MSFAPEYWIVILAAIQNAMQLSLERIDELRARGVKLDDISKEDTTALAAPILIRAFVVDVLVKHGIITPDAGAKLGYSSLMRTVNEVWEREQQKS